ncbi:ribonuclease H1 domain-containing protein [Clostridium tyrobutyricum]|uniref:ribonuclease H1 domain-containing protein n=1 Tax=Clostridium tyrobutyricum TaxID=1519 RepID=UPI000AA2C3A7|nr:viroplasmin family protein [Clostridium tyrobutyricum]MBR9648603.1 type II toxin-antitoxin system RnlA family toxin [Clostridium tyrobutyricum]
MGNKFYAVRKGKKTGIYTTWNECKQCVTGYSGAEYKSFTTKKEAECYLNKEGQAANLNNTCNDMAEAIAYVDGSFNKETKEFSYGAVIFWQNKEYHFLDKFDDNKLAEMHNVAGELKGSERAMKFALENEISKLIIYHDYEGIAKWCTGEWKTKKEGTKDYKNFYENVKQSVCIEFVKVKGHSGDKYNELADKLAKEAMLKSTIAKTGISKVGSINEKNIPKEYNTPVYIDREKIDDIISLVGSKEWEDFECEKLTKVGNADRCIFYVDGKKAVLDFYFRKDGPTTMKPTSNNIELSEKLKLLIEQQCTYKDVGASKTHSLLITKEWATKLVDFMSTLDKVKYNHTSCQHPKHECYQFISNIGDKITFNIYDTGKLVIQGKPAYLYSETISFLAYCPQITIEDILDANNKFQNIDVKTDDIRDELKVLMPTAYNNIDHTIIKILTPSLMLKKIKMELEDYSCYAFPALRALEGYLKFLFSSKNIVVDRTFVPFYDYNPSDGQHYLNRHYSIEVNDSKTQAAMEEVYNYFRKNRHILFHTEQILFNTVILDNRQEADLIINEVINLIENTYNGIIN